MESVAANSPSDEHGKLSIFALAVSALALVVGGAFAAGWLIGRILL